MPQSLLEMAKELVTELIRVHRLSPEDAHALLMSTHATLQGLHQQEAPGAAAHAPAGDEARASGWRRSISQHAVTCLECGESFRQLSSRHLRQHGIDTATYRRKYGIPRTQPLSSRQATARRRQLAREIRPWEQAAAKRTGRAAAKRKRVETA